MNNSQDTKPDIAKLIDDFYAERNKMKNLKPEDFDISPEGVERLLKKLDELEAFALKTKEMLDKKEI